MHKAEQASKQVFTGVAPKPPVSLLQGQREVDAGIGGVVACKLRFCRADQHISMLWSLKLLRNLVAVGHVKNETVDFKGINKFDIPLRLLQSGHVPLDITQVNQESLKCQAIRRRVIDIFIVEDKEMERSRKDFCRMDR